MNGQKMMRLLCVALATITWLGLSTDARAVQVCNTSLTASTPTTAFIDNADGTVTHTLTGLRWKRCSEGQTWSGTTCTGTATLYTWSGALNQAVALNNGGGFAGFTDWRVPNIKELLSIAEYQCSTPAINATVFPAFPPQQYWSTTIDSNGGFIYTLNYSVGDVFPDGLGLPNQWSLLLVRDGF